jgi:hypothetical protein
VINQFEIVDVIDGGDAVKIIEIEALFDEVRNVKKRFASDENGGFVGAGDSVGEMLPYLLSDLYTGKRLSHSAIS